MMRRLHGMRSAFTMTELMTATSIAGVIMITGWAVWEMTWRSVRDARAQATVNAAAFGTLQRIEQEVMRGTVIEVPDPDYTSVPSMQVRVKLTSSIVRRAFRKSGDALIVDLKDEGVAPYTAFTGLSALAFTMLDAPTNSMVEVTCTCTNNGQAVQMRTVATKRN